MSLSKPGGQLPRNSSTDFAVSVKTFHMLRLYCLLLLLIAVGGCSREKQGEGSCFDGFVRWQGDPAVDGLGWTIHKGDSVNSRPFIPHNLPQEFQQHELGVHVCLYPTGEKFYCNCIQPLDKYHITSIRRR